MVGGGENYVITLPCKAHAETRVKHVIVASGVVQANNEIFRRRILNYCRKLIWLVVGGGWGGSTIVKDR